MPHLISLQELSRPEIIKVAETFADRLPRPDNADIFEAFPAVKERYGSGRDNAIENLFKAQQMYEQGVQEHFVVFRGIMPRHSARRTLDLDAVGYSRISINAPEYIPKGIKLDVPNTSGFILEPDRGKRLGEFSLEERVDILDRRFGGNAWTLVKRGNVPSERNIQKFGFNFIRSRVKGWPGYSLYGRGDVQVPRATSTRSHII